MNVCSNRMVTHFERDRVLRCSQPPNRVNPLSFSSSPIRPNGWDAFARYLGDGCFEIDNNLVENCMRPVKLGAKNWLFFGSDGAGHHAAAIYALVENCRRFGVPVEIHLKELLTTLPSVTDPKVIASLTPANIAGLRSRKKAAA